MKDIFSINISKTFQSAMILFCLTSSSISLRSQSVIVNDDISILTWNMYLLPPIAPVTGRVARAEKISEVLNESTYDILCLQEAFHHEAVAKIKHNLKEKFPYQYGPFFESKKLLVFSSGLLICSRTPLVILDSVKFSSRKGIDVTANKGAIIAQALINGKDFQIVASHTQAGNNNATREKQFVEIKTKLLDRYAQDGVPQIICGDLNTERKDKMAYDEMLATLQAVDGVISGEQRESYDGKTNKLAKEVWKKASTNLDYVLLKKNNSNTEVAYRKVKTYKRSWKKGYQDLSDHYGVECKFTICK